MNNSFAINPTAIFFLGAAWERQITGSDDGIEYVDSRLTFSDLDVLALF